MSTWDEDYPCGYECCASGSCEVCCGGMGIARAAAKRRPAVEEVIPREVLRDLAIRDVERYSEAGS